MLTCIVFVCVRAYVRACVCLRACVRACVRGCMSVCVCVRVFFNANGTATTYVVFNEIIIIVYKMYQRVIIATSCYSYHN